MMDIKRNGTRIKKLFCQINWIQYILSLTIFIAILLSSYLVYLLVDKQFKKSAKATLSTVLHSTNQAINTWTNEQRLIVQTFNKNHEVITATKELLKTPATKISLAESNGQRQIQKLFIHQLKSEQYRGFFLVGPGNVNLASFDDQYLGKINILIKQPKVLKMLWEGQTTFSSLNTSDNKQAFKSNNLSLYIGNPIKDDKGKVIALFILKIDPFIDLFKIMQAGYLGETGESYAFDDQGVNLLIQQLTHKKPSDWLLTDMAKSTTKKQSGINTHGYRDHRGVLVIGAWTWNKALNIGLASEQDVDEAYALLSFVKLLIILGAAFFTVLLISVIIILNIDHKKTLAAEKKLAGIIETAVDGIITISVKGIIENVNPAAEKIFGYKKQQLEGRNVKMLMPESYHSEHHSYIKHYLHTGKTKIIGSGREVMAKRADGSVFPISLNVARLDLADGIHFSSIIKDITRDKKMLADLKKERDKFAKTNQILELTEQALNRTSIGEFWINPQNGRIMRASQKVSDQLGYTIQELKTMHIWDFDPRYEPKRFFKKIASLKVIGWDRFESYYLTKDGHKIPVEITAMYHREKNTDNAFIVAFAIDITQRKEAENELILSRKAAEDANKAKSTFLAVMSHEIRTPLNGIVGTADMLNQTTLTPGQKLLINTSIESAKLLQRVIDDVLDFSKIEAGKLELEQIPVNIEKQLDLVANNLCMLATKKQVELLVYCDPNIPTVEGDPVRLQQILFNLGGNAIKFSKGNVSKTGKVFIAINLVKKNQSHVSLSIKVTDNGIGMSETVRNQLFLPFSQAEQDTTRRYGGTGLGLTITKRLLEMMRGTITVTSEEGVGSEFTALLTLKTAKKQEQQKLPSLQNIEVLLIKHTTPIVHQILHSYILHAGAKIIELEIEDIMHYTSTNVNQGITKQIIVMDTKNTPKGLARLKQILSEESRTQIPYLLLTRGQRRQARKESHKSFSIDLNSMSRKNLINSIASATGLISHHIEVTEKNTVSLQVSMPSSREQAQIEGKLVLLVDDNEINRKVIGKQLEMLGYWSDQAEDGQQALSLWKINNYNAILTDCHMPILDGYELTCKIRSQEPSSKHIPIIAITADALKGTAQKCYTAGIDAYITKPMQLAELKQVLAKWITKEVPSQKQVNEGGEHYQEVKSAAIDTQVLSQLLGTTEPDVLTEYYQDFLISSLDTMDTLKKAYSNLNTSDIGKVAHKLKSSARTVGANLLADCCLELELAGKQGNLDKIKKAMPMLMQLFTQVEKWIKKKYYDDD